MPFDCIKLFGDSMMGAVTLQPKCPGCNQRPKPTPWQPPFRSPETVAVEGKPVTRPRTNAELLDRSRQHRPQPLTIQEYKWPAKKQSIGYVDIYLPPQTSAPAASTPAISKGTKMDMSRPPAGATLAAIPENKEMRMIPGLPLDKIFTVLGPNSFMSRKKRNKCSLHSYYPDTLKYMGPPVGKGLTDMLAGNTTPAPPPPASVTTGVARPFTRRRLLFPPQSGFTLSHDLDGNGGEENTSNRKWPLENYLKVPKII